MAPCVGSLRTHRQHAFPLSQNLRMRRGQRYIDRSVPGHLPGLWNLEPCIPCLDGAARLTGIDTVILLTKSNSALTDGLEGCQT